MGESIMVYLPQICIGFFLLYQCLPLQQYDLNFERQICRQLLTKCTAMLHFHPKRTKTSRVEYGLCHVLSLSINMLTKS